MQRKLLRIHHGLKATLWIVSQEQMTNNMLSLLAEDMRCHLETVVLLGRKEPGDEDEAV